MKIYVQLDARDGAAISDFQTAEGIAEEKLIWKYWSEGFLRDMYFQTDRIGVILMFEAGNIDDVRAMVEAFPFVQSGLLNIASLQQLAPFTGLEALFDRTLFA